jgi:hypothetical protein
LGKQRSTTFHQKSRKTFENALLTQLNVSQGEDLRKSSFSVWQEIRRLLLYPLSYEGNANSLTCLAVNGLTRSEV